MDIICERSGELVFVEVKTRSSKCLGNPIEAVGLSKQRQIVKAADEYVKTFKGNPSIRFDIIGIIANEKTEEIEHIEDAFYPTL